MSQFEKNMEEIFDVPAKIVEEKPAPLVGPIAKKFEVEQMDEDLERDYQESRRTLKALITKGNDAIDHLLGIATETEHPRAFEVLSNMIKNISDVNDKLMELNKKTKDITQEKEETKAITNNNVFIGSTTDLQRLLKQNEDEKVIDVSPSDE